MSRISAVLKNRNRVERLNRDRRKEEMLKLKNLSAFKARLYDELKQVGTLLDSIDVEYVRISVPEKYIPMFNESIYSEDLAEYDIEQVESVADEFNIRKKFLSF